MADKKTPQSTPKKNTAPPKNGANKQQTVKKKEVIAPENDTVSSEKKIFGFSAEHVATAIFVYAILFLSISLFSGNGNSLWDKLRELHFGLWGFTSYLYCGALTFFAVLIMTAKPLKDSLIKFAELVFFVLLIGAAVHIFTNKIEEQTTFSTLVHDSFYKFRETGEKTASGIFSAIIGSALMMISHTKPPAVIIITVLIFVSLALLFSSRIKGLYLSIGKTVVKTGENTSKKLGDLQQKRKDQRIEREEGEKIKRPRIDRNPFAEEEDIFIHRNHDFSDLDEEPAVTDYMSIDKFGRAVRKTVNDEKANIQPKNTTQPLRTSREKEILEILGAMQDNPGEKKLDDFFTDIEDSTEIPVVEVFHRTKSQNVKTPNSINQVEPQTSTVPEEPPVKKSKAKQDKDSEDTKFEIIPEAEDEDSLKDYHLPPFEILKLPENGGKTTQNREELLSNGEKLINALSSFNVDARIIDVVPGPSVTRYEVAPAPGVKISKFTSLADDLALHLAAPAGVRIEAPIPNKSAIGIEIPNKGRVTVAIREILDSEAFRKSKSKLTVALGKDIAGNCVCADLAKMPHLLIAGTTGSGKSVCLNTLIMSILYNATPDEVKLLLVDPKQVEFSVFNGIPHLLVPVVNDPRKAAGALAWAVTEMISRYKILNNSGARDITAYNELCNENDEYKKMPQIVIIIDELSDMMAVASNEVEESITRLAQMARAAGMHLVVATQRPSVDVITGLIKANIPSRIALSVSSQIDSRTIIDSAGAEKLLGNGDMLFCPVGNQKSLRVQGCFVSDNEIKTAVNFIKNQLSGEYDEEIQEEIERQAVQEKKKGDSDKKNDGENISFRNDEILMKAIDFVVKNPESCSISSLQRKLSLGFSKAGRYMDIMEEQGFVGPNEGSKPRKVLYNRQQWFELQSFVEDDEDTGKPAKATEIHKKIDEIIDLEDTQDFDAVDEDDDDEPPFDDFEEYEDEDDSE